VVGGGSVRKEEKMTDRPRKSPKGAKKDLKTKENKCKLSGESVGSEQNEGKGVRNNNLKGIRSKWIGILEKKE